MNIFPGPTTCVPLLDHNSNNASELLFCCEIYTTTDIRKSEVLHKLL